ncbi:MAG: hypothetical protein AVDCRST_MAG18-3110 [uncultured Thermomicrobiales bacterium]|uniref:Uncharacterized protein n=1 Tax=uncultured Thermomicrobiales bacterium TaxID=1645740 RepID=A0A6J4VJW6_9BACT|nr:MAG: hypothetical protein AVDCRST_MAG18-3110 [uncultured Thermomicrobiales bacterium]
MKGRALRSEVGAYCIRPHISLPPTFADDLGAGRARMARRGSY